MSRRSVKSVTLVTAIAVFLGLLACGGVAPEAKLEPSSSSTTVGVPVTLKLSVQPGRDACSDDEDFRWLPIEADRIEDWAIDPSEGAVVDANGVFTASAPGDYKVTAHHEFLLRSGDSHDVWASAVVNVAGSAPTMLYDNHNDGAVENGGKPATFELKEATTIATIENYHYAEGKGTPGGGTIGLKAEDGTTYGPWETETTDGQGGVPNAYWTASVNIVLPPGSYTITDSDPRTWSQNEGSKGVGMTRITGAPAP